ncbi:16S rRNA (uracil(1498)-N(3))-methyltransferase [Lacrimispora sp. NSJ-141]|uniref:Ribosomal RNA small subunit methyltransferase E n=1 Tax=Lientehia hominis TaxID=2897778 RepID=A0AAP2RFU3_9FIRM|nr:RsmE family RNA methyltransferase [Lientehia hominis]MCD2491429.1 16S rRNA (uracil(1498)-N(3))-methyltransferase [Lientehia hominis]
MYLFFVAGHAIEENEAEITGPDVNHIKNVLRMKPGDKVRISDGEKLCYSCVIEAFREAGEDGGEAVLLKLLERDEDGTELPAEIVLYQGLPKGDKMELIIQKNVELGIKSIVPVNTKRAVVKLDEKKAEARRRRWNAISESAAKQSKRTVIPEVKAVMDFKAAIDSAADFDCKLFPYENAEGMEYTRKILSQVRPGTRTAVFIGPEGGFDEDEVSYAKERGFVPITLGRRILRTETAGFTLLAALMLQLEK